MLDGGLAGGVAAVLLDGGLAAAVVVVLGGGLAAVVVADGEDPLLQPARERTNTRARMIK